MTQQIFTSLSEQELDTLIDTKARLALKEIMANFTGQHSTNYSTEEAAKYLCIPKNTLSQFVFRRLIKFSKLGKRNVFQKVDLDEFVLLNSKKTATQIITDAA
jgi:excisionase family DNA binding protein